MENLFIIHYQISRSILSYILIFLIKKYKFTKPPIRKIHKMYYYTHIYCKHNCMLSESVIPFNNKQFPSLLFQNIFFVTPLALYGPNFFSPFSGI